MVGTAQPKRLKGLVELQMGLAGQVVERADRIAVGLRDPAHGPLQHEVRSLDLAHRFGEVQELASGRERAAGGSDDRVDVAVEDG